MSQVISHIMSVFAILRYLKLNLLLMHKLFIWGVPNHLLNIIELIFKTEKFSEM